jgi:hypothetical protein
VCVCVCECVGAEVRRGNLLIVNGNAGVGEPLELHAVTNSSFGTNAWLACPGRVEVCRRGGCREPAVDDVTQLCAGHLSAYRADSSERVILRQAAVVNRTRRPRTRPRVRTA